MNLLYKINDIVRIKRVSGMESDPVFCSDMEQFIGKEFKIVHIDRSDPNLTYFLSCGYWWRERWLESTKEAKLEVSSDDLMELLE